MTVRSDEELWQSSRQGDRAAFGELVERYQRLICSLAYSGTGSAATSEELAQETFLAAWRHLNELREPAKLRPWLCGILRNLVNQAGRKLARHGGPALSLDGLDEPAASSETPESRFAHKVHRIRPTGQVRIGLAQSYFPQLREY